MEKTKDKIRYDASQFRLAIESTKERIEIEQVSFKNFPKGSCGVTSILLGIYLHELGYGPLYCVRGRGIIINDSHKRKGYTGFQTHSWLEKDNTIIDITADQFSDIKSSVIVIKDKKWHYSRFPDPIKDPVSLNSMCLKNDKDYYELLLAYRIIVRYLYFK